MISMGRRNFLAALGVPGLLKGTSRNGIRIDDIRHSYEDYRYRTPYKFGGREVDRVTLLNVECRVRDSSGKTARGFGSMTMGNVWAFPSRQLTYDQTLGAMKQLAGLIRDITADYPEYGHPIDINVALEPSYLDAAAKVSKTLSEPIPKLCTLVTASSFDAAIHDAFGKLHDRNCYRTYGPDLMPRTLDHYLGPDFKGEHLNRYVLETPQPRVPLYHSVGASDPIVAADIRKRINDGLPETLPEWIRYNGLTHIKIKLNGDTLDSDVERVAAIHRATAETEKARDISQWFYCLDFNERCPNVEYLLEFLRKLPERAPGAIDRIQYIEQPTARDLAANRSNTMHAAAKIRPVVIDESLTDIESLLLAKEMGYSGVALKACKGQSQVLLMSAVTQKHGMFRCVQDLTCPGASLIHSVGLAAHTPGAAGVEANAREYVPAANKPFEARFPGIFNVKDGEMRTTELNGPGLSAV
jgi:L-alanine-DL-glutamate epimerase-like enolase superfamily enzyme